MLGLVYLLLYIYTGGFVYLYVFIALKQLEGKSIMKEKQVLKLILKVQ